MATELIGRVSPSLFSRLERCALAEALSRQRATSGARPARPPARLGTAAHEVIDTLVRAVVGNEPPEDLRAWVRVEWQARVGAQYAAAQRFDEERLLGLAHNWPGYFDIEARLTIESARVADEVRGWSAEDVHVERWMHDDRLGLEGKPDLVVTRDGGRLIDFKSGRPTPADVQPGTTYASQIAIYSALLRSTGVTVAEAAIQPFGLYRLPVSITEEDEEQVADRARGMAARFNSAVTEGRVDELGSPSDAACGWCPHAAICPALWKSLDAFVEMHAVEGDVLAIKQSARGASVRLTVERGTRSGALTVTQLRPAGPLRDMRVGDRVRLAGLSASDRSDVFSAPRGGWLRAVVFDGRD